MKGIKKGRLYREVRHIWRAFFVFGHGTRYIYSRFVVGPRITRMRNMSKDVDTNSYSAHFLCSHSDFLMFCWSLASWYRVLPSGSIGEVFVHEDGSFTPNDKKVLARLFPHVKLVRRIDLDKKLGVSLRKYSKVHEFRFSGNALSLKLIDPYFTGDTPYKLILDTDIMWFKKPDEIIDSMRDNSSFATLGYTPMPNETELLKGKSKFLNSGIIGCPSIKYSLDKIEYFLSQLPKSAHFIEQAAYSYMFGEDIQFLPEGKYHIKGPVHDGTVSKHYTSPRREMFWYEGIRKAKHTL